MIRRLRDRLSSGSRGQALVETALIMSLLLVLALGTFDIGRGLAAHIALTEATQEGALYAGHRRYSALASSDPNGPVTDAQVQSRVQSSGSTEAVTNATVSVTCTTTPSPGRVTVTSTYALPVLSPFATLLFGPTFTLSVDSKTTILRGSCS